MGAIITIISIDHLGMLRKSWLVLLSRARGLQCYPPMDKEYPYGNACDSVGLIIIGVMRMNTRVLTGMGRLCLD